MLIRFHHVLADGLAALLLLGALFDLTPEASVPKSPAWTPGPVPDRSELLLDNLRRRIAAVRAGMDRIEHPRETVARCTTLLPEGVQLARAGRAPVTSFNQPVGKQHRLMLVRADLARAKGVAHAHHATVNDVVLCATAGGVRALLAGRGELRRELVLTVSVAASVRASTRESQTGNLVGVMLVPLPVGEADPIRRLEQIARATAENRRADLGDPTMKALGAPS